MPRALVSLAGFAAFVLVAAAPVPKHLMPKEQSVPFPTAVGSTWVYEATDGERTRVITDSKTKDAVTLVTSEWRDAQNNKLSEIVWSVTAAGVFSVSADDVKYDPPWCIFAYPYREGRSWTTNQRTNGTDHLGTRKAGPMERVKVPAGEFTAVRVEWKGNFVESTTPRATLWYAPGVGQVKLVYHDDDGKEAGLFVLKSFTPGKN